MTITTRASSSVKVETNPVKESTFNNSIKAKAVSHGTALLFGKEKKRL